MVTPVNHITVPANIAGQIQQADPNALAQKVSKIFLGTLAVLAISNIPVADAGPIFGSWCLLACLPLLEAPPLLTMCIAACGMVGIGPTP